MYKQHAWAIGLALLVINTTSMANVYTVGSSGTYSSLQAAVNAANAVAGAHEIRLQAQTLTGGTLIGLAAGVSELKLSGGWNDSFTVQSSDPGTTRLSGAGLTTTLVLSYASGTIWIDNLRIADGAGVDAGGGLDATVGGAALLRVERTIIEGNSAQASVAGAGASVYASANAQVMLRDCDIRDNTLVGSTGARGAAIYVATGAMAQLSIERCSITGNSASSVAGAANSGVYLNANGSSTARISQSNIGGNIANGINAGAAVYGIATQSAQIVAEGLAVIQNTHPDASVGSRAQIYLSASDTAAVSLRDSASVRGPDTGAIVQATAGALARVTNVTVADNGGAGLLLSGVGTKTAFNNILHSNALGSILDTPSASGNNLGNDLGASDPQFVNAAGLEYSLQPGSPAIDAGNASPPGGLGAVDVIGEPRVQGITVDIGAFERSVLVDAVYANGFE